MWQKRNCPFLHLRNNVPALQELLGDLTSGNETRAEKAVPALIELGEDALPALRDLTHATEVDHRWWALRVLAQSSQAQAE